MVTVIYAVKQIDVASKAGSEDVNCPQLGRHDPPTSTLTPKSSYLYITQTFWLT